MLLPCPRGLEKRDLALGSTPVLERLSAHGMICQARNCRNGTQVKSPGVCLRTEGYVFILFLLFAQRTGDL